MHIDDMAPLQVLQAASDMLRGMVIAEDGKKFLVADLANIEGRVLAWLAGEEWKLEAYRDYDAGVGPDLYRVAYGTAFGVDPNETTDAQRFIGKVMELALGYYGGVGAVKNFSPKTSEAEADRWKKAWRAKHPKIVQLWHDLGNAWDFCLANPGDEVVIGRLKMQGVKIGIGGCMRVTLPSGRSLWYQHPSAAMIEKVVKDKWGDPVLDANGKVVTEPEWQQRFYGAKGGTWGIIPTHSGVLTENCTQAVARDILAVGIMNAEYADLPVVLHVHDEIVCEVEPYREVRELVACMVDAPEWAEGLPLAAEGFEATRYRK